MNNFFTEILKFLRSIISLAKTLYKKIELHMNDYVNVSSSQAKVTPYEKKYDEIFRKRRMNFIKTQGEQNEATIVTGVNPNNYILEETPRGNILIKYNNEKEDGVFIYYSDSKNISFLILESVAKKYTMTFQYYNIYKDFEEEMTHINKIDKMLKEAKRKQVVTKKKINKYVYGGTLRDFDFLNKKTHTLEQKQEFSYRDFAQLTKK